MRVRGGPSTYARSSRRFGSFYLSIQSVHLKARAEITRTEALEPRRSARVGTGTIEYWEIGDRFRRNTRTSPQLGLIDDMDAAYDGSVTQVIRFFGSEPARPSGSPS